MKLGVHVSIAGGIGEALARTKRLSCNTMQIFSRSPRGGPAPVISDEAIASFHQERCAAGIEPFIVHGPYIINLASPETAMFEQSVRLYHEEYRRCVRLRADYLVTHVGSLKGSQEADGIRRVADAINRTLDGLEPTTMILLENTAGSGQGLGNQFEHLAAIRDQVARRDAVGVCLDTAHLFAAGYPIHTAAGLEATIKQFDRVMGLEHVKVLHLNDSKSAFDSRVDRHWHIGQGGIGLDAMRRIVTHPALRDLPMILETPKDADEDDPRNLALVRSFAAKAVCA